MRRQPRDPRIGIFTPPVVALLLVGGAWSALVIGGLFITLLRSGRPLEQVMALTFVSLVLIQFFNAYNCRSDRLSIVRRPFANRWLNLAILWELLLLGIIVSVPFFHEPFGMFRLGWTDWALCVGLAATIVPVLEFMKWTIRRRH